MVHLCGKLSWCSETTWLLVIDPQTNAWIHRSHNILVETIGVAL